MCPLLSSLDLAAKLKRQEQEDLARKEAQKERKRLRRLEKNLETPVERTEEENQMAQMMGFAGFNSSKK